MMRPEFDPYDQLMQLTTRCKLLEEAVRELQLNQLHISRMLEQQNALIKQNQENEKNLGEFVAQVLLDNAKK